MVRRWRLIGYFPILYPPPSQLMEAMVTHLEALLAAAAAGPLSFAVVVPGWTEVPSWAALQASRHLRRTVLVAKADHGYCDGAQHQRQDRFRDAPYDTAVFFLQNQAGAFASPPKGAAGGGERAKSMCVCASNRDASRIPMGWGWG
jgi:phosphorylated CTD-interacting factor 1